MPKLWNDTIETHRREVREAILDSTWALVNERGPTAARMSEVAERTGIGRATLYKYFPDVESILTAWHYRQITRHTEDLEAVRTMSTDPMTCLRAALDTHCRHYRHRAHYQNAAPHGGELVVMLHRGDEKVDAARARLHAIVADLIADAARAGEVRADVGAGELAEYCLHALTAAEACGSEAELQRLVGVTLDGLRPAAVERAR